MVAAQSLQLHCDNMAPVMFRIIMGCFCCLMWCTTFFEGGSTVKATSPHPYIQTSLDPSSSLQGGVLELLPGGAGAPPWRCGALLHSQAGRNREGGLESRGNGGSYNF